MKRAMLVGGLLTLWWGPESQAQDTWAQDHPRRHEVNQRLKRQNNRINAGGGQVTKGEQRVLDKEENQANRPIKRDKRRNAR